MPRGPALMQSHIRSVMNDHHLITVGPDDSLVDVARELASHGYGAVPVVGPEAQLIGIVSTTDLVNLLHDGGRLDQKRAADVMSRDPISIDEFATVEEAIGVMRNALIRHLPVTREGRLVGFLTHADLMRHLVRNYTAPDVA